MVLCDLAPTHRFPTPSSWSGLAPPPAPSLATHVPVPKTPSLIDQKPSFQTMVEALVFLPNQPSHVIRDSSLTLTVEVTLQYI